MKIVSIVCLSAVILFCSSIIAPAGEEDLRYFFNPQKHENFMVSGVTYPKDERGSVVSVCSVKSKLPGLIYEFILRVSDLKTIDTPKFYILLSSASFIGHATPRVFGVAYQFQSETKVLAGPFPARVFRVAPVLMVIDQIKYKNVEGYFRIAKRFGIFHGSFTIGVPLNKKAFEDMSRCVKAYKTMIHWKPKGLPKPSGSDL